MYVYVYVHILNSFVSTLALALLLLVVALSPLLPLLPMLCICVCVAVVVVYMFRLATTRFTIRIVVSVCLKPSCLNVAIRVYGALCVYRCYFLFIYFESELVVYGLNSVQIILLIHLDFVDKMLYG